MRDLCKRSLRGRLSMRGVFPVRIVYRSENYCKGGLLFGSIAIHMPRSGWGNVRYRTLHPLRPTVRSYSLFLRAFPWSILLLFFPPLHLLLVSLFFIPSAPVFSIIRNFYFYLPSSCSLGFPTPSLHSPAPLPHPPATSHRSPFNSPCALFFQRSDVLSL